jgi:hypothetical protein
LVVKLILAVAPEHIIDVTGFGVTVGFGLIVIEWVKVDPGQATPPLVVAVAT